MTPASLTITISRTALSLPDLVFSGTDDANVLGIASYQQPALQPRFAMMPDSADVHGDEPFAWAYQQAVLGFDWFRAAGSTETEVQASRIEVATALAQFSFLVTTQVSGAPAEAWSARPGAQVPSARTYSDLTYANPVFAVSIPVYPIPS